MFGIEIMKTREVDRLYRENREAESKRKGQIAEKEEICAELGLAVAAAMLRANETQKLLETERRARKAGDAKRLELCQRLSGINETLQHTRDLLSQARHDRDALQAAYDALQEKLDDKERELDELYAQHDALVRELIEKEGE